MTWSTLAIRADVDPVALAYLVNASLVNWFPWSLLKIYATPYVSLAAVSASTQKFVAMLIDTRCASALRVAQSTMATSYMKPRRIGM
ncbi:MAG: hypothetical protein V4857_19785 [Pseudomonadota bacterium]